MDVAELSWTFFLSLLSKISTWTARLFHHFFVKENKITKKKKKQQNTAPNADYKINSAKGK